MMNILLSPFKRTLREREINEPIKEDLSQSDLKVSSMSGFVTMNYMFFIIYGVFYTAVIYLIFVSFLEQASLLKLIIVILLLWYFSSSYHNIYLNSRLT